MRSNQYAILSIHISKSYIFQPNCWITRSNDIDVFFNCKFNSFHRFVSISYCHLFALKMNISFSNVNNKQNNQLLKSDINCILINHEAYRLLDDQFIILKRFVHLPFDFHWLHSINRTHTSDSSELFCKKYVDGWFYKYVCVWIFLKIACRKNDENCAINFFLNESKFISNKMIVNIALDSLQKPSAMSEISYIFVKKKKVKQ